MKVLVSDPLHEDAVNLLKEKFDVAYYEGLSREKLLDLIPHYDVLVCRVTTTVDKKAIDAGTRLSLIACPLVGTSHIDVDYAKEKGIKIINFPGVNADSVAELTIGHIINSCRFICKSCRSVKEDLCWNKYLFVGSELAEKTIGIIAYGQIGRRVGEIAKAFKMKVLAFDPFVEKCPNNIADMVELDYLLENSDIVSVHAPLTRDTHHLISRQELERMKDGSYLFCTSRGGILDEEAVVEALDRGKLAGVGVDVIENEGDTKTPVELTRFINHEKVGVTPHIGGWTHDAQYRVAKLCALKVIEFAEEQK